MNRAIFLNSRESNYYLNDEFIFNIKRKVHWSGLSGVCEISESENLLCKFYYSGLVFEKIELLSQNLKNKILLNKLGFKYCLIVDGNKISIKYNRNPFSRKICRLYFNGNFVCEIELKTIASKSNYVFDFHSSFDYKYEAMIIFAISNVGIEDSA
jgi:hypothetical protein